MKSALKTLTIAASLSFATTPAFAAEEVKIGVPSWTGAQAIAHLMAAVVEMRIGGEAELVPGNNATIFQVMDQGRGDIDVHPDVLLPNQESFTKKYVDEAGSVVLSANPYQGNQGFCVSKEFGEANNITDIADLRRPDVAALKDVQIAWSKLLGERSPVIAEFFERFSLTADDVSSFAFEISGNGREPSEVVREWVEANPERVDAWLGL
ncbi:MAG: glycine betaine ABC transporter substrate-binding protein [Pseudomonadota bacterium]